jgi:hypothetical protein
MKEMKPRVREFSGMANHKRLKSSLPRAGYMILSGVDFAKFGRMADHPPTFSANCCPRGQQAGYGAAVWTPIGRELKADWDLGRITVAREGESDSERGCEGMTAPQRKFFFPPCGGRVLNST